MNNIIKRILKNKEFHNSSVLIVIIISLINVFVAMSKDIAIAGYLGTTDIADSFFLAFFLPDTIGNNLFAVACGVAAIPILAELHVNKRSNAFRKSLLDIIMVSTIGATLLMVCTVVFSKEIIQILGSGFNKSAWVICSKLLFIMAPTMIIYPLVTLSISVLQIGRKFIFSTFAAVVLNLSLLLSIIILYFLNINKSEGIFYLAITVAAAVLIEVGYLIFIIIFGKKNNETYTDLEIEYQAKERKQNLLRFWNGFWPYFLMLTVTQSVLFYERHLGTHMGFGSVAAINYANRLSQFPVLVFSLSIALVALPELSRAIGAEKKHEVASIYLKALKNTFLITIPMAIGLVFLREPVISILFKHNSFDYNSVNLTSQVLMGYGIAIIGQGITLLNIRVLVAVGKRVVPLLILISAAGTNMLLDNLLISKMGITGIGIGAAVGAFLGSVPVLIILAKRFELKVMDGLSYTLKVLLCNLPSILIAIGFNTLWNLYFNQSHLILQLIYGFTAGIAICGASYICVKSCKLYISEL